MWDLKSEIEPTFLHWRVDSSPLDCQGVLSVLVLNLGDGYLLVVSYSLRCNGLAKMFVQVISIKSYGKTRRKFLANRIHICLMQFFICITCPQFRA